MQQFFVSKNIKNTITSLLNTELKQDKFLQDFLMWFNKERLQTEDCLPDIILAALNNTIRHTYLGLSIGKCKFILSDEFFEMNWQVYHPEGIQDGL